jgi:uncharacterized membrane protein
VVWRWPWVRAPIGRPLSARQAGPIWRPSDVVDCVADPEMGMCMACGADRGEEAVMESRAKAFGHAIHPMLIVFPLGLLSTAVVFDILWLITHRAGFPIAAGYAIAAGIVGGLLALVFGLTDWLAVPAGTRAKRVGLPHGLGNVVVVVLFAVSWLLRWADGGGWRPGAAALACGFAAVVLAGVTGWLGGELVERLRVGVDDGAGLDAPNSLSRQPATNYASRSGI